MPDITLDDQGKVSAASQLIMKPMPLAKFIRILQSFCISCGLTEAQAKCITSYALRRFLPTVAGALKIPEDMAEAVGDWQQATAARALPPAMATRYNDDRVSMAADVKTRLLMAVGQQARALNKATVSWDEMRAAFTWEDICKWQLPKFGQTTAKEALGTAEEILSDSASVHLRATLHLTPSSQLTVTVLNGSGSPMEANTTCCKLCVPALWFLGAGQCLLTLLILIGETASRKVATGAERVYSAGIVLPS